MRKVKKGSGVYSYLDALGLLENGTDEELKNAKKVYWNNYKKEHRKENKRKSLKIFFDQKEYRKIIMGAAKHRTSKTNFIKQCALLNRTISQVIVGEIRELIILHHNTLLSLSEEKILSVEHSSQLIEQISEIEKKMLQYLQN